MKRERGGRPASDENDRTALAAPAVRSKLPMHLRKALCLLLGLGSWAIGWPGARAGVLIEEDPAPQMRLALYLNLKPSRYGIQDGERYRVLVRFAVATEPELEKVLRGAEVVYDAAFCELHRERMSLFPVPTTWGNPTDWNLWPSAGPVRPAAEVLPTFPNYVERLNGGCLVTSDRRTTSLYICPACARAFQAWKTKR